MDSRSAARARVERAHLVPGRAGSRTPGRAHGRRSSRARSHWRRPRWWLEAENSRETETVAKAAWWVVLSGDQRNRCRSSDKEFSRLLPVTSVTARRVEVRIGQARGACRLRYHHRVVRL